jgi:hypothetical protein
LPLEGSGEGLAKPIDYKLISKHRADIIYLAVGSSVILLTKFFRIYVEAEQAATSHSPPEISFDGHRKRSTPPALF